MKVYVGRFILAQPGESLRVVICALAFQDTALLGGPNDFVHLDLKPHGKGVGDDFLGQFPPGNGALSLRNFFEGTDPAGPAPADAPRKPATDKSSRACARQFVVWSIRSLPACR